MVDMNAPTFDPFPCDITNPRISWEDNWLFRKQMEAMAIKTSRPQPQQPVSMLVPNPVEFVKPRIGNKDFDLVSELSEQQSVVSFDVSSSDSDDEVNNGEHAKKKSLCEESEKDKEYTIYDMVPIQRCQLASPIITTEVSSPEKSSRFINLNQLHRTSSKGDLELLNCPNDIVTHEGKIVTLEITVKGSKPLGILSFILYKS